METLEVLGYFAFCWLFLLSTRFRKAQIQEWRNGGVAARLLMVYEAIVSLLFGVVIPIAIIGYVIHPST